MFEYTKLYYFYRTALMRSIRLIVFSLLFYLILNQFVQDGSVKLPLFLFNILVMFEVFFHFKIGAILPPVTVSKNDGKKVFQSFTRQALYPFASEKTPERIINRLIRIPQVQLFMRKANISRLDLHIIRIDSNLLSQSAFDAAKTFRGKYVTTVDIFVAYLLLTEKDEKLLFAKQLKSEDLYNISYWIRAQYPDEENPKKVRVRVTGGGIGEQLVSGWTYETRNYTSDFARSALRTTPLIRGREDEFKQMLEGLVKIENNNVLLVGDIGAGKENLVRALSYYSFEGELGSYLNFRRILELMVGSLTAGASSRGELEERLQAIIAEVSHAEDILLYIPEFQNVLGGSSYGLDLSGALLPFLKTGNLPIIATMSVGSYKQYMEKNPLREAFSIVELKEPDKNTAVQMVLGESTKVEHKYKVILSYLSVLSAVELSEKFFKDQVLPGSAVALLETVANKIYNDKKIPRFEKTHRKIVLEEHVVKEVESRTNVAIGLPTGDEIDLLLHLEDRLHERVIEQDEAITAIAESLRRVRSGVKTTEKPISFLFLGPTGVGKTETAKALSEFYFKGVKNMIRLDMSEYTDEDGIRRLLGSPPGAGDERGELTDKINDNPSSLVLLDEFEKANPKIHNLFLQVFDDGRLTDNKGKTVNFGNVIIIATSNAGSEFVREEVNKGTKIDKKFHERLLEFLQSNNIFKPELLNRFDGVITFKPLTDKNVVQVVKLLLQSLTQNMEDQDIKLVFDDAVIEKISKEGFDPEFGARPLKRYIQDNIEDMIAEKKLKSELKRGNTAKFAIDGTGALQLTVL